MKLLKNTTFATGVVENLLNSAIRSKAGLQAWELQRASDGCSFERNRSNHVHCEGKDDRVEGKRHDAVNHD